MNNFVFYNPIIVVTNVMDYYEVVDKLLVVIFHISKILTRIVMIFVLNYLEVKIVITLTNYKNFNIAI